MARSSAAKGGRRHIGVFLRAHSDGQPLLIEQAIKKHCAQVALSGIRQHHHDRATGKRFLMRQLHRHCSGSSAGDPRKDALLPGEAA